MTSPTGNATLQAEQHLDVVEQHLGELRTLLSGGALAASVSRELEDQASAAETFGRWVLDLLGHGEAAPAEAVPAARAQLVAALSKHLGPMSTTAEQRAHDDDYGFVDVFAGEDLVAAPDEELGVKPISFSY
jgi:hypothetical protein